MNRKTFSRILSEEIQRQSDIMQTMLREATLCADRLAALTKVLLLYQPREGEQAKPETKPNDQAAARALPIAGIPIPQGIVDYLLPDGTEGSIEIGADGFALGLLPKGAKITGHRGIIEHHIVGSTEPLTFKGPVKVADSTTMASIASTMTTDAAVSVNTTIGINPATGNMGVYVSGVDADDATVDADMRAIVGLVLPPVDAAPALTINEPVPAMGTSDGVALSAGESEGDVTPVASLSPTNDIPGPGYGHHSEAAGGDEAPALESQGEPAADAEHVEFFLRETDFVERDYATDPVEPTLEAIHQQGLKELDAIEAAPANPAPAADVESLEPEQPVRKSVKRDVAKPARAAAAPVAAGDKVKVETIGSGVTRVSQGVVTIDFGRLMVICHRGQFRGSLANLQALEKLNDGGLYSFETIQRAAGYATVDRLMQDIPTIRDKLGDAGITLTATKGIGCRMWRAEK